MLGDLTIKLNAETVGFTRPIVDVKTGLEKVSAAATTADFNLKALNLGLKSLEFAANSLRIISDKFGSLGKQIGGVAIYVGQVTAGISVVGKMAALSAAGISVLLKPLYGIGVVVKSVTVTFGLMFKAVTAPFRILTKVVKGFFNAIVAVAKPVFSLAKFFFKLKVAVVGFRTQIKVLIKIFAFLPPQIRLVVAGLTALGIAGKAGAWAMGLVEKSLKLVAFAALAVKKPLTALRTAIRFTAISFVELGLSATKLSLKLAKLSFAGAIKGLLNLGRASLSAAGSIAGKLVGSLVLLAKTGAMVAAAGVGWGIKLAADAEQAEIAFTTMLKSGGAARRVLGELEQFAASTPFQLVSLQDGAKQLLNAQVPTEKLTNKLRMLGDIAAGTGKPINDFVRIYAKVKSTGKVSLETLNQLAERGVPIYSSLSDALGVSRKQMLKMISQGKVGFKDLNKAIESTATGSGVFAGGMAAQSQTIAGLWSTLKDNIGFSMRELGLQVSKAFDFKGLMDNGITFFQGLRTGIASATPVFIALANTARSAFNAVSEAASVSGAMISKSFGLAGRSITQDIMGTLATLEFAFKSWPDIAELAFTKTKLFSVQAFSHITHFFTGTLPVLLDWFGSNWANVFKTAGTFVGTVFVNMKKNIFRTMDSVWEYIKSGGTKSLKVAWEPLSDGFKTAITKIPALPDRPISQLEDYLEARMGTLNRKLGSDFWKHISKNMNLLKEESQKHLGEITGDVAATLPDKQEQENPALSALGGQGNNLAKSVHKGSKDALDAINRHRMQGLEKSEDSQKTTAKNTQKIAANTSAMSAAITQMNERLQSQPQMQFIVGGLS